MYHLALTLSIISSLLVIVYLLMLIFSRKQPEPTITISGRIVTSTVTYSERLDNLGRTIEQR